MTEAQVNDARAYFRRQGYTVSSETIRFLDRLDRNPGTGVIGNGRMILTALEKGALAYARRQVKPTIYGVCSPSTDQRRYAR